MRDFGHYSDTHADLQKDETNHLCLDFLHFGRFGGNFIHCSGSSYISRKCSYTKTRHFSGKSFEFSRQKLAILINHFQLAQGLIVGNFFLVDTYAPDVFSTDVRNFTFCFLDSVSKIGTTFAPFIIYWGNQYMTGLPPAIFGAMIITSSVTLLFTPETKGYPLVQTLSSMKDNKGYPSIFQRLRLRLSTSESLV